MAHGRIGSVQTRKTLLRKHLTRDGIVVHRNMAVRISKAELYENKGKPENTPRKDD